MVFNMSKWIARHWGVEVGSPELKQKMREMREKDHSGISMVPCGPTCPICHDSSYECDCESDRAGR